MGEQIQIRYTPTPTGKLFHCSEAYNKLIMGPIGSGKSVCCVMELYGRALQQNVYQGVRRSRYAVIRQTYPELEATTMKTWADWIPEVKPNGEPYCKINRQRPPTALLQDTLADGTMVHMEVHFLALDRDEDVKKLLSLELTGAWINESKEVPKSVWDMCYGRCDRYPSKRMGGCKWHGVICDTNPPDDEHYIYQLAQIERPKGYAFFQQPPAIVPLPRKDKNSPLEYIANQGESGYPPAENVENHNAGFDYWLRQCAGKDEEWIKVYLMGMYGNILSGKPVYPEYSDGLHCAKENLNVFGGIPLIVGMDFGLTPAAVFCQISPKGQFRTIDELVSEDMGIRNFARNVLKPHLYNKYAGIPYSCFGDPAGTQRSQSSEVTCMQELQEAGIICQMARTNEFIARREAVAGYMNRLTDGEPAFLLSPSCKVLRKAFMGGYHYRKMRVSGGDRYAEVPEKNRFSHCIAKGTLIDTQDGLKPIEMVKPEDMVLTPAGLCRVLWSGLTRVKTTVYEIETENGNKLKVTGDHLVWTNDGWKSVDALQYTDVLYCICKKGDTSWEDQRNTSIKCSMESSITRNERDILKQITTSTSQPDICTEMYGHFIMDRFQKIVMFIIKMATRVIMQSKILNVSARNCMPGVILSNVIQNIRKFCTRLLSWQEKLPKSGTDPNQENNGILFTQKNNGVAINQKHSNVQDVVNGMMLFDLPEKKDFVLQPVNQRQEGNLVLITSNEHVQSAGLNSQSTNILKLGHAVRIVGLRQFPEASDVYDLTVEKSHCFFANGILVHNCSDALQYAALEAEGAGTGLNRNAGEGFTGGGSNSARRVVAGRSSLAWT